MPTANDTITAVLNQGENGLCGRFYGTMGATSVHAHGVAPFGDRIDVISGGPGPAFTFGSACERLEP